MAACIALLLTRQVIEKYDLLEDVKPQTYFELANCCLFVFFLYCLCYIVAYAVIFFLPFFVHGLYILWYF